MTISFNSSLKDTGETALTSAYNGCFPFNSSLKDTAYSTLTLFSDTGYFQFLIKGYTTKRSIWWCWTSTFNSSLKDTQLDWVREHVLETALSIPH